MAAHADPTAGPCPCPRGLFGDISYDKPITRAPYAEWCRPTSGVDKGLKVRNSLTAAANDSLDTFTPGKDNRVSWYTCGPTVYDSCHMGHARAYLTFDILRRITEDYFKYDVMYHINITDIDDKIILRSRRNYLLQQYQEEKNGFDVVLAKVKDAMALQSKKLEAKAVELEQPLPETAISRDKIERQEQLKVLELKNTQFQESLQAVTQAEREKSLEKLFAAAKSELSELLDNERGASVTDHSVFMAHAKKYEKEYFEDMEALGVKEPDVLTRVTEYVPQIVAFIQKIVDKGLAYESGGSVYLSIEDFKKAGHTYRKLRPGKDTTDEEMAEGEGALGGDGAKKHKNDFALWKKSKVGEPFWPSPWGEGRPGWHIECSVIASDILGPVIDVHAGGVDLKFPHHDNELAQSEACFGHSQWINYFFHAGHLQIKGLKMSKSLKNFVTIRQALEKFSAREIRMMFLLQPWWKEMNFSDQTVDDAISKDKMFREFFHTAKAIARTHWAQLPVGFQNGEADRAMMETLLKTQQEVDAAFKNNFDTPTAVLAIGAMVTAFNKYSAATTTPCVHLVKKMALYATSIFRILGLVAGSDAIGFGETSEGGSKETVVAPYLDAMVAFRAEVRTAARSKEASVGNILKACDDVRDNILPPLGVRLDDLDGGKSLWKLDDPEVLMKEVQAKKDAAAAAAVKKLEGQVAKLEKEYTKMQKALTTGDPAEMFKVDPEFKGWTFGEDGLPAADAEGTAVAKSKAKTLTKRKAEQEKAWKDLADKAAKADKDTAAFVSGLATEIGALQQKIADAKAGASS